MKVSTSGPDTNEIRNSSSKKGYVTFVCLGPVTGCMSPLVIPEPVDFRESSGRYSYQRLSLNAEVLLC